jgi:hypothetical protein
MSDYIYSFENHRVYSVDNSTEKDRMNECRRF